MYIRFKFPTRCKSICYRISIWVVILLLSNTMCARRGENVESLTPKRRCSFFPSSSLHIYYTLARVTQINFWLPRRPPRTASRRRTSWRVAMAKHHRAVHIIIIIFLRVYIIKNCVYIIIECNITGAASGQPCGTSLTWQDERVIECI